MFSSNIETFLRPLKKGFILNPTGFTFQLLPKRHRVQALYNEAKNTIRSVPHISLGIIMLSFSRILLVILNLTILFSSLAQINVAKSLAHDSHRKLCLQENAGAIAFNATFLLITSIIGIIGTSCKVKSLQAIYLWIMLILTVSSFVYVTFISVLMPRVSADRVWENSKDGYWLNEYQPALQKALINGKDWFTIRNCYVEFGLCNAWRNQSRTMNQPTNQGRNYVELGCCYPPARCQLVQTNGTLWQTPKSGVDPNDKECVHWTISDRVGDCYDCDSCKAGYLTKYQENWQQGTFMHIFRLVFLTVVSALALYAFNDDRNARLEHYT
ncbi:tetraspanin-7-like [Primulina tabacum]|uniref:tetraspanin-7-like n=1 Tax=Primulina tabacum TaxID=48773 RepID=UPI003F5AD931